MTLLAFCAGILLGGYGPPLAGWLLGDPAHRHVTVDELLSEIPAPRSEHHSEEDEHGATTTQGHPGKRLGL